MSDFVWSPHFSEGVAFYKDIPCHRPFIYGMDICREVALHKDVQKVMGMHYTRISCFVRSFHKDFHLVYAFCSAPHLVLGILNIDIKCLHGQSLLIRRRIYIYI